MGKKIRVGSTTTSLQRAKARAALQALYRPDEPIDEVARRFAPLNRPGVTLLVDVMLGDDVLDEEHDDPALASVIRGRAAAVLGAVAGLDAFDALVDALDLALLDEDFDVVTATVFALRDLGKDVGPMLLAELVALDVEDDPATLPVEGALCEALAECGARSDDVYARLLRFFDRQPDLGSLHLSAYGDARATAPIRERFDVDAAVAAGTDDEVDARIIDLADALDSLGASWDDAARARVDAARAVLIERGADETTNTTTTTEGDGTT